jgi:predicted metal-binding membrane protein
VWPRVRDDKLFASLLLGLIVLAWISLWIWSSSPWGRFLGHQEGGEAGVGDDYAVLLLVFVAGWTLMTTAMMLPTSLPLVTLFRALVRKRDDRGVLVRLVVLGYLGVWTVFALVAHAGDRGIHAAVHHVGLLENNTWTIGAGTVLMAGLYQFSSLKYRCLEKCRSPFSFVMSHWRGGRGRTDAFRLGVDHGLFCLGCCWSLMLVMFAVGLGNLAWMLVLAAVIAFEKNHPLGHRLSAAVGAGLLLWGTLLIVLQTPIGDAG